ncbi:MAG: CHASE2 domain-containing protein, partial [Candidatus Marinimicrobia bacterium]|nr:CHASE2 domain-containing protein [Candidatus Neomarinimicrobiota bacterium]
MINKNFMKKYLYLSIAFFVVLFFILLSKGSIYHNQLYSFTDWKWRQFHHPEMADSSVVLVAIDNKSLDFVENRLKITWPWPREFYALIYDYLSASHAASVTFDILMDDPERDRMEFAGGSSDGRLAASFSKNDIAILAAMIQESSLSNTPNLHKHELIFDNSEQIPGVNYNDISLPLREFREAGADIGIANFRMDSDGICRRLPLFFNLNNVHLPQLALSAYLKGSGDKIISYDSKKQILKTQQKQFKLDKDGNFPIFWYGPGDANGVFRYDSFHALLMSAVKAQQGGTPDILPQEYKGKHIIICASA